MQPADIASAVEARLGFAEQLFADLANRTHDVEGVTRPAWSERDRLAEALVAEGARSAGLELDYDPAGNLYITLPGTDRSAPAVLTGSHLDTVPRGGNYDGGAGIAAGLTALAALKDLGVTPPCDLRAVALTGEESVWYGIAYLGSRLAVGALPVAELDRLRRSDTGGTLAEHMAMAGIDVDALRQGAPPYVTPDNTKAFLELHIEQGPVLVGRDIAVAVPTAIRGNRRYTAAHCGGAYAHSAAVPREHRQDAALATVELLAALDAEWQTAEAAGVPDTVFTVGKLFTDPDRHAMTKVPGDCTFTLNFGGTTKEFLDAMRDRTEALAEAIGARRNVVFELGDCVGSDPTPLDPGLRAELRLAANALGIPFHEMATVGHDASVFARAGVPAAMVIIRNQRGSHNPDEAMDMADFGLGTQVLAATLLAVA
jgi:N-carbamoyl-L-amino-acid hydrolase